MNLNIMQKLFIVASLPIITLLVLSINTTLEKYSFLETNEEELHYLETIKKASDLITQLQLERGISSGYLIKAQNEALKTKLVQQHKNTDLYLKDALKEFELNSFNETTNKYFNNILPSIEKLIKIREKILSKDINWHSAFNYYTNLNAKLIIIIKSFQFSSKSLQGNSHIAALQSIIDFQEYAGRERGLVNKLANASSISQDDMKLFNYFVQLQDDEHQRINYLHIGDNFKKEFDAIEKKFQNNYFALARAEIFNREVKNQIIQEIFKTAGFGGMIHELAKYQFTEQEIHYKNFLKKKESFDEMIQHYLILSNNPKESEIAKELKDIFTAINPGEKPNSDTLLDVYTKLEKFPTHIDAQAWFDTSSQRINEIEKLEDSIYISIKEDVKRDIQEIRNTLWFNIALLLITTLALYIGTHLIANSIKRSIQALESGLNNFFAFLNFTQNKPENINTHTDDEISQMAQSINDQMLVIEKRLEEDLDFINELTHIVTLMKDGDFSERTYFEPQNPYLKELRNVFDELIELISQKIKEQTTSLEKLNASLEDRVHQQTLELEKQIQEITVARDKAVAAERAKDEFLANMSHEIRTPLNAILGFVTILQKQIKEENSLKYLNIISTSGKSLLTIINDILDFSKIQSGKFDISPHKVNIVEEMSNAVLLFASKAYEKHLIYDSYIDVNMPQKILIDEVRVKQIFSNILSNAIKFTQNDKSIEVSVTLIDEKLIISVKDTGIGIAKENIPKVFNAFEQADGSTTRKYGGTGLGMSISKRLADLMNGSLELESQEGVGSTFTLSVPIEIVEYEPYHYIDSQELANKTIAVLDYFDNSVKLKLIKRYLRDLGAKNILDLTSFQEDGYDLLFFIPDDLHNEEVVESKKPAIAILRNSSIKLAELEHIHPLYAPFTPQTIINAIKQSGVLNSSKQIEKKEANPMQESVKFHASVLVAEDNKTNQMLISLLLDNYGMDYQIVDNGLKAYEEYQKNKYDLILMDENMPVLNGIAAMQKIKEYEQENDLEHIPIIVVTASVLEQDKKKFTDAGMDGFVGKPIDTAELTNEISRFLTKIYE